jgi:uncharacterized Zn finger protein
MTTSIIPQPDTIQLLEILAPQHCYKDNKREDGFASRFERGRAIFQRGSLYRSDHKGTVRWSVPSWRNPRQRYNVYLDSQDGEHQCDCQDRAFCCHIFAAGLAEQELRAQPAAVETLDELTNLLWGAYA